MKLAYLYGIDSVNPYLSTYSHYPVTKNISFIDEIKQDKPLLIVGIKKARELYPNKIDLDNNHIDKNIYWCYSPDEYLSEFLKKYEEFILNIHTIYLNLIEFDIIDVFFSKLSNKNDLLDFITNRKFDILYQLNKMLYCYSKTNNKIYIINLNEFFWFNLINIDEYTEFVKDLNFYYDSDNKIFNYFTNLFLGQDNFLIEKTIPYFIYLKSKNKH
jgi:hypothetical protein